MIESNARCSGWIVKEVIVKTDSDADFGEYCPYDIQVVTNRGTIRFRGCHDMTPEIKLEHNRNPPPKFMVDKPFLHFDCQHAVFPSGGESSICYCSDRERAQLIADALTAYLGDRSFDLSKSTPPAVDIDGTRCL